MEMTLGEKIRNARKRKMTQVELANEIGVHEMTVRRWEVGKSFPDVDSLLKISEVLHVPFTEFTEEEAPTLPETSISRNIEQSSSQKENSVNSGMLVYETKDGYRFEAPPTEIGIRYLEKMFAMGLSPQGVMA